MQWCNLKLFVILFCECVLLLLVVSRFSALFVIISQTYGLRVIFTATILLLVSEMVSIIHQSQQRNWIRNKKNTNRTIICNRLALLSFCLDWKVTNSYSKLLIVCKILRLSHYLCSKYFSGITCTMRAVSVVLFLKNKRSEAAKHYLMHAEVNDVCTAYVICECGMFAYWVISLNFLGYAAIPACSCAAAGRRCWMTVRNYYAAIYWWRVICTQNPLH